MGSCPSLGNVLYCVILKRDPDVTCTKVYFPQHGYIHIHQNGVFRASQDSLQDISGMGMGERALDGLRDGSISCSLQEPQLSRFPSKVSRAPLQHLLNL